MISVIVPIYNAEKYLVECLDSIAHQTFSELEVILVNDGSTDSSKNICEKYCGEYSNFKLINKENGGQMSAWMLGVQHSRGEFVGFVDADDYVDLDFYEKMFKLQTKYDADLVMCSRLTFDTKNNCLLKQPFSLDEYYSGEEMELVRSMFLPTLTGNLSQARWDKLFKKDILKKCMDLYCKTTVRTFEDRFIVVPYVFYSSSFAYLDEPLYHWRQVPLSSSRKSRPELCNIADYLFKTHTQLIKDLGVYEKYNSRIELEKIDILRNIFERNLCISIPRKEKKIRAKELLSEENRNIVIKHKTECIGKFGRFYYLCNKHNSIKLLIAGSSIYKRKENSF